MPLLTPSLPPGPVFGALAEYAGPAELVRACELCRDAGFTRWDAHAPFPVHGMERAMGLRRSRLPYVILACALGGAAGGFLLQTAVHSVFYPLVISGKPFFSWPAYVPITFELGVLGGALAAVFGMLGFNQLPTFYHPLFHSRRFERVADDGFFISIESWDPKFDRERTVAFLQRTGASGVELVES